MVGAVLTMKEQELLKVYRTFWTQFERLCRTAGAVSKPSNGSTIQIKGSTKTELVVAAHFFLKDWRLRATTEPSSPSDRVQILLRSQETYSRADNRLSRSSVQVLYMKLANDQANSLLGVHYDYASAVQSAHPVFHAQFGKGDFNDEILRQVEFRSPISALPHGTVYSSVRIPTACMNFASVLLGLAADHLDASVFGQVLKLVRTSEIAKWNAHCESLQRSVANREFLPSHHWYEEPTRV